MNDPVGAGVGITSRWPLVGRTVDLERIADAIGRTDVSGVVLVGEAGVGKTRLATEALAIAGRIGFATGRAVASRAAASIPLGALASLLPSSEPARDLRHDALAAAVAALAERASDQPFMLLVDDAHLLDNASATVLHQLATGTPVFVLATVRSGEAPPDVVAALWKDNLALRVDVGPLPRGDVERLLAEVLGGPVDGATLADLWWSSRGNPLFLHELVMGAIEAGLLLPDGGVWRLRTPLVASPRLAELVDARLTDLEPAERAVLEILAFGEPLALAVLATVGDADAVESTERQGLVHVEMAGERRVARLAHPMHGEVLRERTPALRAMAIQRRLVETIGSAAAPDNLLRVAVWTLESEGDPDPNLMCEGARQALLAHDVALAERLARAALARSGGTDAARVLGEALFRSGRHEEAVRLLKPLLDDEGISADHRATVALTMAEALFNGLGRADEATATLRALEATVADDGWRAESRALRAAYQLLLGQPREALDEVGPLLETPRSRAFVVAGTVAGPALAVIGRCDEAIEISDRAFAAHLDLGPQAILAEPGIHLVSRALALGEAGRLAEARATAQAGYDGSVAQRSSDGQAWFSLILARSLWLTHLTDAARWFREGATVFGRMGYGGQRRWCLAGAAFTEAVCGNLAAARAALASVSTMPSSHVGMMLSDVERATAWVEELEGAGGRPRLEHAATHARESGCFALETAALHDFVRWGYAEEVVERLSALAVAVDGPLAAARADHAQAAAAASAERLEAVGERFDRLDAAVLAAEAFAQASAAWRRHGTMRASQRCQHRAVALSQAAGGVVTPAMALAGAGAALTKRELEVASLAAQGLSNKAIAERLFVSARTVGNHLQRAYEKLGVAGREELDGVLTANE